MSLKLVRQKLEEIVSAKKENRSNFANLILENEALLPYLVTIAFNVNDKISIKAAWILEWICTHHHIKYILPYLDVFCNNIKHLQFDSAIRPCAKICEQLAIAYHSKEKNEVKIQLTKNHINSIVEAGFDWLITPQKIAVRAYTMNTLFLFGKEIDWIHPELKHIILTKVIHESKGTKARGNFILAQIEKHRNSHL